MNMKNAGSNTFGIFILCKAYKYNNYQPFMHPVLLTPQLLKFGYVFVLQLFSPL